MPLYTDSSSPYTCASAGMALQASDDPAMGKQLTNGYNELGARNIIVSIQGLTLLGRLWHS